MSDDRFKGHTPGPWMLATSNSWRRFVASAAGATWMVCEPIKQPDGHPDLHFHSQADAALIAAAPELLSENIALRAEVSVLRDTLQALRAVMDEPEPRNGDEYEAWSERWAKAWADARSLTKRQDAPSVPD